MTTTPGDSRLFANDQMNSASGTGSDLVFVNEAGLLTGASSNGNGVSSTQGTETPANQQGGQGVPARGSPINLVRDQDPNSRLEHGATPVYEEIA